MTILGLKIAGIVLTLGLYCLMLFNITESKKFTQTQKNKFSLRISSVFCIIFFGLVILYNGLGSLLTPEYYFLILLSLGLWFHSKTK